jgi:hypothetical protein
VVVIVTWWSWSCLREIGDDAQCSAIELLLEIAEPLELERSNRAQRLLCDAPDVQPFEAEFGLFEGVHRAEAPFTPSQGASA